jgi:hypothetical protein
MNHDLRFSRAEDEREWAVQERALAEERAGIAPAAGEPALRSYRLLAHVLTQPLPVQLPADFARRVARRSTVPARAVDTRLEAALLAWLVTAMALAALAAVLRYGGAWLPAFDPGALGRWLAQPWLWTLAACLGLSRLARRPLHALAGTRPRTMPLL